MSLKKPTNPILGPKKKIGPSEFYLGERQSKFIEEIIRNPRAPKQAAIKAGYSVRTASETARDLLETPKIQRIIESVTKRALNNLEITTEKVLNELALIALSPGKTRIDEEGNPIIELDSPVEITTTSSLKDGNKITTVKSVKPADRIAALQLLGKYLGMFKEQVEVSGQLSLLDLIEKSLEKPVEVINPEPVFVSEGPYTSG